MEMRHYVICVVQRAVEGGIGQHHTGGLAVSTLFRNCRLGDIKAKLEQLAVNPRRAPKRIFLAHTAHELSGFLINSGQATWIVRSPAPPGAKTHPVPANDCLGTHDRRGVADIGETPIQPDEQRPITAGKPQPFRSLSVQNVS